MRSNAYLKSARQLRREQKQGKNIVRIPEHTLRHAERIAAGFTPLVLASEGLQPLPRDVVESQVAAVAAAWQALSQGKPATPEEQATHWKRLAAACNITRARARAIQAANPDQQGGDDMAIMLIELGLAEDELRTMRERGERNGSYAPNACGLQVIPALLDFHAQILSLSAAVDMQRALQEVTAAQAAAKKRS